MDIMKDNSHRDPNLSREHVYTWFLIGPCGNISGVRACTIGNTDNPDPKQNGREP
jgi:hypothetical protein